MAAAFNFSNIEAAKLLPNQRRHLGFSPFPRSFFIHHNIGNRERKNQKMPCFVPFSNRNLDISILVFIPMVVVVDDLIDALKLFSSSTESMGCVHSSIFRSIHGNMIIWYGAWMKRSNENKEFLHAAFLQMLTNVSSMAILADHSFFDAYAGESKDGFPAAKFSTGGIISIGTAALASDNLDELSHANLALFKAYFQKMEGAISGVCLRCEMNPRVACLFVWKSLHACYSWILNTDYRATVLPYLNRLTPDIKFDIFRVLYVSDDNVPSFQYLPPQQMLENGGGSKQDKVMQGSKNAAADV